MSQTKRCSRCREDLPLDTFAPSRQTPDGLFRYCRPCKRISDRESHGRHKEKRNGAGRARYQADPEPYKARARSAYAADPAAVRARAVAWNRAHPVRRSEILRKHARGLDEAGLERRREVWRRRQAAIRRGCSVYPFTVEQLTEKVRYWGEKCWMCRGPVDAIDHVKPLSKNGPHMLANLRPICTPCNTRKWNRWPMPEVLGAAV